MRKNKKLIRAVLIFLVLSTSIFLTQKNSTQSAPTHEQSKKSYIEGEVLAKFSSETDIDAVAEKYNLQAELLKSSPEENLCVLKSTNGITTKNLIKLLQKDSRIISIQPNFRYKPLGRVPNDRYFSQQWPLADTASIPGAVSASSAWETETKKQTKVPIAVIDTGVSFAHPEIKDSITGGRAKGKNFAKSKKKPQDLDGHGTFISGIIAAKTNNKRGVAGASFFGNLKIMPLKFDFTTDQAISAINYAKARQVPIINASWGSYGNDGLDPFLKDTIAAYPGIFVTAAGNGECASSAEGKGCNHDSGNADNRMYPCDFDLPNIICVGASDRNGNLTNYSDYGILSVDVVAPGGLDNDPIIGLDKKKNRYDSAEGSSLATAYVSAEAGLILSKHPTFSASQIIEIIKNSVDSEPSLAGKISTGGKINFQKALELAATY